MSAVPIPQLHYRRMRAADLPEVARLEKSLYAFPWSLGNFRDSVNAGYDCWTRDATARRVIGYAVLMIALDEAHLLNIAVAAEWQNQGIGRAFLRHMVEVARAAGCQIVYLEVRPSNVAARHLYRARGLPADRDPARATTRRSPAARTRFSSASRCDGRAIAEGARAPAGGAALRAGRCAPLRRRPQPRRAALRRDACVRERSHVDSRTGLGDMRLADAAHRRARLHARAACASSASRRCSASAARPAPWLFVGEGPGADEDEQGEPFVGQAGQAPRQHARRRSACKRGREVYIANVVKCRPPGNRTPTPEEAAACAPYLDRQIELIAPKLIVALGKTAAMRLLGDRGEPRAACAAACTLHGHAARRHLPPRLPAAHPPRQGEGLGRPALRATHACGARRA